MKYLSLIIFIIFFFYNTSCIHAQCTPDTSCHDTGPTGQFCPMMLQNGTVGVAYSKVITVIPPDTTVTYLSQTLNLCEIKLDSITNLPPGLIWTANSNGAFMVTTPYTRYCVQISGTPTTPGTYNLHIKATPFVTLPIIGTCYNSGTTVIDSTSVTMTINLPTGINNLSVNKNNVLNCSQNPFNIYTKIYYYSNRQEPVELKIHDMLGNTVYCEKIYTVIGENTFKFKGTELHSGMYMYSVSDNKDVFVKKLIKTN